MQPRRRGAQYPKELANWALVSVGVGAVEGAVAAALVKALYTGAASPWRSISRARSGGVAVCTGFDDIAESDNIYYVKSDITQSQHLAVVGRRNALGKLGT